MLKLSKNFKDMKRAGVPHRYLEGKNIVLLFQKTSTRTRCAFEVGGMDLGMGVTYLDPGSSQMGKKESIEDTARVLGRMYDGIEFRGFAQDDVEELAAKSGVPVWNGLTTEWHPTQMLADILTVQENFNYDIKGKTLVFMGDCKNNVARSLMVVCSKLGMNFVACGPEECMPADDVIEACKPIAEANGCTITLTEDLKEACTGADVIYTDVWVSMGEPDEVWAERIAQLKPRIVLPPRSWLWPTRVPSSCTACRHSTTPTPPLVPRSPRSSASPRWRSRTPSSSPRSPRSSTRPRTACTPSRLSCTPRSSKSASSALARGASLRVPSGGPLVVFPPLGASHGTDCAPSMRDKPKVVQRRGDENHD